MVTCAEDDSRLKVGLTNVNSFSIHKELPVITVLVVCILNTIHRDNKVTIGVGEVDNETRIEIKEQIEG